MAVSTSTLGVATMGVVVAGQWSKGTLVPIKVIVGGTVYILILSFADEANPKLARLFGILVLTTALFMYAVPIFEGVGLLGEDGSRKSKRQRRNRNRGRQ